MIDMEWLEIGRDDYSITMIVDVGNGLLVKSIQGAGGGDNCVVYVPNVRYDSVTDKIVPIENQFGTITDM